MLRALLTQSPQTVSDIAAAMAVSVAVSSDYLRLLQSRGLIRSERIGRQVLYTDAPDPAVPDAATLLDALRTTLTVRKEPLPGVLQTLTAFTHPRRILIVRALDRQPVQTSVLGRTTGISSQALSRHLSKLERRGVIEHERGRVCLCGGGSPLMRCLLRLARGR
jgi:DNA-binding MarR family transcriptional regulator